MSELKYLVSNPVEVMKANIAKRRKNFDIFMQVVEVLKGFEGKQITQAIATAVQKLSSDYLLHMEKFSSTNTYASLNIWGEGITYNDAIRLNLGYSSDRIFKMANFEEYNQRYFLEKGRLDKLEERLDELPELCEKYMCAVEKVRETEADLGIYYCYVTK